MARMLLNKVLTCSLGAQTCTFTYQWNSQVTKTIQVNANIVYTEHKRCTLLALCHSCSCLCADWPQLDKLQDKTQSVFMCISFDLWSSKTKLSYLQFAQRFLCLLLCYVCRIVRINIVCPPVYLKTCCCCCCCCCCSEVCLCVIDRLCAY